VDKVVLFMWTSLDGFIAGPDDGPEGTGTLHLRYRVRPAGEH
jgi:hypothetical protein